MVLLDFININERESNFYEFVSLIGATFDLLIHLLPCKIYDRLRFFLTVNVCRKFFIQYLFCLIFLLIPVVNYSFIYENYINSSAISISFPSCIYPMAVKKMHICYILKENSRPNVSYYYCVHWYIPCDSLFKVLIFLFSIRDDSFTFSLAPLSSVFQL